MVIPAATGQTLAASVRGMVVLSVVAALVAVNAMGDVVDPATGRHMGGSDPRSDGVALGYPASVP